MPSGEASPTQPAGAPGDILGIGRHQATRAIGEDGPDTPGEQRSVNLGAAERQVGATS